MRKIICVMVMAVLAMPCLGEPLNENPEETMIEWLEKESAGQRHVSGNLATVTPKYKPSSRMVNIFWDDNQHISFYTHAQSKKVAYIQRNPYTSLNIWLPTIRKQITVDGKARFLKDEVVQEKWLKMPRWMQLRFMASDHRSELNDGDQVMRDKLAALELAYPDNIPMPDTFVGYYIDPNYITFFEVNTPDFASKRVAQKKGQSWSIVAYQP